MMDLPDRLLPPDRSHYGAPLGAQWDGRGVLFSLFSQHAERIELCVFDAAGRHERRYAMPDCSDGIWRGYLPQARPGLAYGYRAYGPYEPLHGHRFNAHKLLLDPYARQLQGTLRWHDALFAHRIGSPKGDLSFDRRDSAAFMPKAVVVDDYFDWGNEHAPRTPWSDTVIYEMHLRGFSMRREEILPHDRGTFGALGHPASIEYLQRLGVTAVELLPVHAFVHDRFLVEKELVNYWGYNTLAYFAPHPAYLSDGTLGQLKWAVRQLHAAGIEVILDVVYNHTAEGNELGPTLSLRGLDNASYYRLLPNEPRYYINDTGCGNTINSSHPQVIRLVMDSLRWWVSEFHVDGFRFDLSSTLGREPLGFDTGAGLFDAMMQDPLLSRCKLIAEPWDLGPGGYQLGRHPAGMAEWNDKFRDEVRRYWRGDAGMRPALAARLQGSAELFDHHRRKPWASLNFITAHDGFTLRDLTSYNVKHNLANGEDNRDGNDRNDSYNWGIEGETGNEAVLAQRARIQRAMLATLLFSQGTPMLLAGDEFGHTQQGNNNAYCQDNELSWLDWSLPDSPPGAELLEFSRRLLELRRSQPLLRADYFQHARLELAEDLRDVHWFDERGQALSSGDWHNANARLLGLRRAAAREDERIELLIVLFNADSGAHRFQLPPPLAEYQLLLDSAQPGRGVEAVADMQIEIVGHSLMLLTATYLPSRGVAS
ncbi:glycogen operon protein [Solimonas aquatica]|uniref:Glycogen operon protein n=1 Tax=Solimonas aquatica TaxID=489703 RepID=A0A1H9DJ65_9GAMM|nr:glycogen debranching protein GlgX [Solimonas aquatica]SEQ13431.1 glycogen operon protein [Solimonas aquatica]